MKRVISFSLYGGDKRYTWGAIRQANLAPIHYPDWKCRFYVPEDYRETQILEDLGSMEHVEIMTFHPGIPAMFQRFMVADDLDVERFIVRDCDSRLGERESEAVLEWIAEDTILHIMRDHPAHQTMPGGTWGGTWRRWNWEAPKMQHLIDQFLAVHAGDPAAYNADQDFLARHVFNWGQMSATIHDSSPGRRKIIGGKKFPFKRDPWPRFVGEVILIGANGEDVPRGGDWEQIPKDDE